MVLVSSSPRPPGGDTAAYSDACLRSVVACKYQLGEGLAGYVVVVGHPRGPEVLLAEVIRWKPLREMAVSKFLSLSSFA
jgi:hypothetical protein